MGRDAAAVRARRAPAAALLAAVAVAVCGDPVSVVGDIPGLARIVLGVPGEAGHTEAELATEALIHDPAGVVLAPDGVLYVADRANARLLAVTSSGRLRVLADDLFCVTQPCLEAPSDVALDPQGRVLVADPVGNRLWRFDPAGDGGTVVAGTGEAGDAPDGAPAEGSPLHAPFGVAVAGDGTIYVSESSGHRVRTIGADGLLRTVAGTGESGFAGDGGPADEALLSVPRGLDVASTGLWIADAGNDRIRVVDLGTGTIRTVAGNGLRGYSGDGGPALEAALNFPDDVAAGPDGRFLFIADTRNHRVRAVRLESGRIETYVGTGETGYSGELLDAGATSIGSPSGVTASSFGLLFVSDPGNSLVWRIALDL
jgi:sugar lactone lactonase YvrE